jgi:FkbM family methyltransferase
MKLKNIFSISILKRIEQLKSWIKFKIIHPDVPIINPLKVGSYNSQFGQDLFLSSLLYNVLTNKAKNVIIDIGANHPVNFSNSYFFENKFNSKIFAIEPISTFENYWKELRPSSTFLPFAIGSKDISEIILNIPNEKANIDNMFSSILKKTSHLNKSIDFNEVKVPCYSLNTFFAKYNIDSVSFISIDVEGYELEVLKGIDFDKVTIDCFLIENNTFEPYGSEPIREFLKSKGYIFHTRIYCADDVFVSKKLLGIV